MHLFAQTYLVKRKDRADVFVYYSKNGEKSRRFTGVRIPAKSITAKGAISSSYPGYEEDMRKIKAFQDRIEDLVLSYKEKYGEKPPVHWLEQQLDKPLVEARKNLDDALCYWKEFSADKEQTLRNPGTIKRYNNLEGTLTQFKRKKNCTVSFERLDQKFFNDFLSCMVHEYACVRNPKLILRPVIAYTFRSAGFLYKAIPIRSRSCLSAGSPPNTGRQASIIYGFR